MLLLGAFIVFAGSLIYFFLSMPDVSVLKSKNPQTTAFIEFRKRQARQKGKTLKIRQEWVVYSKIPQTMRRAVIVAEDASFWIHHGFDWFEIKESISTNLKKGKYSRGGSTITQQLAKNLYLSPRKSIIRKLIEFYLTWQLEKKLSKKRILELYLNTIEAGRGIFGVGAAAKYYFGKSVSGLSLNEIVRLAAIIPDPLHIRPDRPDKRLKWRAGIVLERLRQYHFISGADYIRVRQEFEKYFDT